MSLADLRAYKKDIDEGDTISPSDWMKAQEHPETERGKAKITRITEANKKAGLDEYLDDKFDPPGRKGPEDPRSPSGQLNKLKSKT